MNTENVNCPNCNKPNTLTKEMCGKWILCAHCNKDMYPEWHDSVIKNDTKEIQRTCNRCGKIWYTNFHTEVALHEDWRLESELALYNNFYTCPNCRSSNCDAKIIA